MKKIVLLISLIFTVQIQAQIVYQGEETKLNNLIHTKLMVDFNFEKSQMNGEAWIDLRPHFYPVSKVTLDAKSFDIKEVKVNDIPANYNYSDDELTVELGKTYTRDESYTVYVNYIAKPNEVTQKGSKVISDAKGLYFIDPLEEIDDKPTQIWTQGETEASSCWFPTIDTPGQKTTQEIYMTVPDKYKTLSNGLLISSTSNGSGLRTDYWKMDQKHAPYLFFMGVGNFSVVSDTWEGKEVSYYVEPEYESVARDIFGNTPEMMTFFSNITGIPYVWDKYSQIVVRDYVSGAMENTTAVVHGEDAQQTKGQLIDDNVWEGTIAHELFHHWFGDLVTTESWANLTVNESFATYSVYLWFAHKYGKDRADAHMYNDIQTYLQSSSDHKDLVRFNYADKEDMFDTVSYHKGSAILHMLRDIIGDEAFFGGLNYYLNRHKFGTAEAHDLRIAFEKVSGRDLNWFFNQWYFSNGHIRLNVSYDYNTINNTVTINLNQVGNTFTFPITIDVYDYKGIKTSHEIWVNDSQNSYTIAYEKQPKLINIDSKHVLLAEINDKKTLDNYIFQFNNGKHFLDRYKAIEEISKHQQTSKEAFNTIIKAFNDPYYEIRKLALDKIDLFQKYNKKNAIQKIERMAQNDKKSLVRAAALMVLGKLVDPVYKPLFMRGIESESNSVKGNAMISLYQIDKPTALAVVDELDLRIKNTLATSITTIYINEKDKSKLPFIAKHVLKGMFLTENPQTQQTYSEAFKWIIESDNEKAIQNVIDDLVKMGKQFKQQKFDEIAINIMNQMVMVQQQSDHANKKELILLVKSGMAQLIE